MEKIALDIAERVLPSGLTLLAVRNPGVSTYACTVALDVGQRDEAAGEAGLANMVGECLEEGTAVRSGPAFAEAVEAIGGHVEGHLDGGTIQCPAAVAGKADRLLGEMVTRPSFPAREVRRVQNEVLTEIRSEADDPRVVARQRFRKKVYGRHPFARPLHGTARTVRGLEPAALRRFHRRYFTPQGGYVAAAGPDPTGATLDRLERVWRRFHGSGVDRRRLPAVAMPEHRSDDHVAMAREQVHVFLGHPGIRRTDPDFYALVAMDHILGSGPGFTSRISKRLRDELGLCYTVHAGITASAGREPGTFTAYIGTSARHRKKAVQGFLQEIRRIRREPPTAQEVEDVVDYLTGAFVLALERNVNLAAFAIRARRYDLGFDFLEHYPDIVRAVTPEDVQRVARAHLRPDRVVVVSAGATA